jgi:hypothetical protein
VHPYATLTRRAAWSSAIHVIIFGMTDADGIGLVTAATAESCAAVTPAKTTSVTVDTLMRYYGMTMATEMDTLALGMELTSRMIWSMNSKCVSIYRLQVYFILIILKNSSTSKSPSSPSQRSAE